MKNEIIIDPIGNCTVVGELAHRLWQSKQCPRYRVTERNCFYVLREPCEDSNHWDIIAAQSTRENADQYAHWNTVLVDVTNAPRR